MTARICSLILVLCCCAFSAFAAELANPRTMNFPPLSFNIPKAERVLLNTTVSKVLKR